MQKSWSGNKNFKAILNKRSVEMEKVCGNKLKHSLLKEFSQHGVETDNQLKLRKLRKNKDELSTV